MNINFRPKKCIGQSRYGRYGFYATVFTSEYCPLRLHSPANNVPCSELCPLSCMHFQGGLAFLLDSRSSYSLVPKSLQMTVHSFSGTIPRVRTLFTSKNVLGGQIH